MLTPPHIWETPELPTGEPGEDPNLAILIGSADFLAAGLHGTPLRLKMEDVSPILIVSWEEARLLDSQATAGWQMRIIIIIISL